MALYRSRASGGGAEVYRNSAWLFPSSWGLTQAPGCAGSRRRSSTATPRSSCPADAQAASTPATAAPGRRRAARRRRGPRLALAGCGADRARARALVVESSGGGTASAVGDRRRFGWRDQPGGGSDRAGAAGRHLAVGDGGRRRGGLGDELRCRDGVADRPRDAHASFRRSTVGRTPSGDRGRRRRGVGGEQLTAGRCRGSTRASTGWCRRFRWATRRRGRGGRPVGVGHQQQRSDAQPDRRGQRRGDQDDRARRRRDGRRRRARRGVGERRGRRARARDRPANRSGHPGDQRRRRGRQRSRSGTARCGSRTASTGRSRGSTRRPTR